MIANGENAAAGAGLTRENADEIFKAGVHVITGGNHIWDKREVLEFIDQRAAPGPAGQLSGRHAGPRRHDRGRRGRHDGRRAST